MKPYLLIISLLLLVACTLQGQQTIDDKIAPDLISADFKQITNAIEQQVPNPFYLCPKARYDSLKSAIAKELNKPLSAQEFYQKASRLVTALNDEHFQLFIGDNLKKQLEESNPTLYFPFSVFINGDKIYTNQNLSAVKNIQNGTEILKINNIPAKQILAMIRQNRSHEPNLENFFERRLEDHFSRSLLTDVGLRNNFTIILKNHTLSTPGVSAEVIHKAYVYLDGFSYSIMDGANPIGYLQLTTLVSDKQHQLDSTLSMFFSRLKQKKVTRLIIDIRDNFGGSTRLARSVFNYITTKPYRMDMGEEYLANGKKITSNDTSWSTPKKMTDGFNGTTVLLTNTRSYSSAHMMANAFKTYHIGKVVGQVSPEPLFISGEINHLVTTNTKCIFYYPTTNFYLPGYKKESVSYFIPDVAIYPTLTDKISGRDEALILAKKVLNN
jgi:C-terminal processing protease CtpA/Prc